MDACQAPNLLVGIINNYKAAVEIGKAKLESEHKCRVSRYQRFDEVAEEHDEPDREEAVNRFVQKELQGVMAQCKRWTTDDFESIQVLGEGSFGVVHLVKHVGTDEFYALKQIKKESCRRKNHRDGAFAELQLLAEARCRWIVDLYATFQDSKYAYMVMEFLQGGDLIGHIMQRRKFTMEETRFYMAELTEALDTVHRYGFVHRDVKPDNMVLTARGHLKLLDFGLCKYDPHVANDAAAANEAANEGSKLLEPRVHLGCCVGTPQYMAPEVYMGNSGVEADIWSIGIITHECLIGHVPFHGGNQTGREAIRIIKKNILRSDEVLPFILEKYVLDGRMHPIARNFLLEVLKQDRTQRLSAEGIRRDRFFEGLDFERVHRMFPPIVPQLTGPSDARYFADAGQSTQRLPPPEPYIQKDVPLEWAHYEFDREAYELQRPLIHEAELFGDAVRVAPRAPPSTPLVMSTDGSIDVLCPEAKFPDVATCCLVTDSPPRGC